MRGLRDGRRGHWTEDSVDCSICGSVQEAEMLRAGISISLPIHIITH